MAQLEDEHSIQQAKRFLVLGNTTEFFERVLSRILVKQAPHPVKEALEFVNEYIKEVPDSTSTDQVKTDATTLRYMKRHNLSDFIDKWILALIKSKTGAEDTKEIDPTDEHIAASNEHRLQFHKKYLEGLLEMKKDVRDPK